MSIYYRIQRNIDLVLVLKVNNRESYYLKGIIDR